MIRDIFGILAILAILAGGVYAMPHFDLWSRDCGAGVMVKGHGGYWLQWKENCAQ